MDLKIFLQKASSQSFWEQNNPVCFRGAGYSSLFFYTLLNYCSEKQLLPCQRSVLTCRDIDIKISIATLSQSFLGEYSFYWLGDITPEGVAKSKQALYSYIMSYKGPHKISFFISQECVLPKNFAGIYIDIPTVIDTICFQQLALFGGENFTDQKNEIIQQIFSQNQTITLDNACLLFSYLQLMSIRSVSESVRYLTLIFGQNPTLSQLSEHFFARNQEGFYKLWALLEHEYPPVFWVAFWTEHIWRAYHVVKYLGCNDFVQAKRASTRLPYSFINRDWKKYSPEKLAQYYQCLYNIDSAYKRGSLFCLLDLFYLNHFLALSL